MIEIQRASFIDAMKKALPGVESSNGKVLLQGADTFVFSDGFVHTYNDNISVSSKLPEEVKDLKGAVKAVDFFNLINKFTEDTIQIVEKEQKWIVKSGLAKVEFPLLEPSILEYVKKLIPENYTPVDLQTDFFNCIKLCLFSSNHSSLSGLYITPKNIVSTDEMRVNYIFCDTKFLEPVWISDTAIGQLIEFSNIKKFYISDKWVHFFTDDGTIFSCKKLNSSNYPYKEIMKIVKEHEKTENDIEGKLPKNLQFAIDRASVLSMNLESFSAVRLSFSKEGIVVYSERSSGKYTELVEWDSEIQDFPSVSILVDSSMIQYGMSVSKSFYLKTTLLREKEITKVVFVYDNGILIVGTFEGN